MSSPIANRAPSLFQKLMVSFHQRFAHSSRTGKLSAVLGQTIEGLAPGSPLRALDVGCGDMTIAETIARRHPSITWTCTDIHKLPEELKGTEKWKKYRQFDGDTLPFAADSFDVVLFCDVLHHCPSKVESLLTEAGRVGKYVVIKDHFEGGWYSRQILRLLDFAGNYGYGIQLPQRYFDPESFRLAFQQSGLRQNSILPGIDLYSGWPFLGLFLRKNWQFVAVLSKASDS